MSLFKTNFFYLAILLSTTHVLGSNIDGYPLPEKYFSAREELADPWFPSEELSTNKVHIAFYDNVHMSDFDRGGSKLVIAYNDSDLPVPLPKPLYETNMILSKNYINRPMHYIASMYLTGLIHSENTWTTDPPFFVLWSSKHIKTTYTQGNLSFILIINPSLYPSVIKVEGSEFIMIYPGEEERKHILKYQSIFGINGTIQTSVIDFHRMIRFASFWHGTWIRKRLHPLFYLPILFKKRHKIVYGFLSSTPRKRLVDSLIDMITKYIFPPYPYSHYILYNCGEYITKDPNKRNHYIYEHKKSGSKRVSLIKPNGKEEYDVYIAFCPSRFTPDSNSLCKSYKSLSSYQSYDSNCYEYIYDNSKYKGRELIKNSQYKKISIQSTNLGVYVYFNQKAGYTISERYIYSTNVNGRYCREVINEIAFPRNGYKENDLLFWVHEDKYYPESKKINVPKGDTIAIYSYSKTYLYSKFKKTIRPKNNSVKNDSPRQMIQPNNTISDIISISSENNSVKNDSPRQMIQPTNIIPEIISISPENNSVKNDSPRQMIQPNNIIPEIISISSENNSVKNDRSNNDVKKKHDQDGTKGNMIMPICLLTVATVGLLFIYTKKRFLKKKQRADKNKQAKDRMVAIRLDFV